MQFCRICKSPSTINGDKILCSGCGLIELTLDGCINRWCYWIQKNNTINLGVNISSLGRAIDSVREKRCPRCNGRGGACDLCGGEAYIRMDGCGKINPAFIHGNDRRETLTFFNDTIAEQIDTLLIELGHDIRRVFVSFYLDRGGGRDKARKLKMGRNRYYQYHNTARDYLDRRLKIRTA